MERNNGNRVRAAAALLAACLLAWPSGRPGAADIYPSAGSAAAAFLKIGVGARAVAMGGAYTAVPGDPYALYWNPAGLAGADGRRASFTHNDYFAGLAQEYAVYTLPAAEAPLLRRRFPEGTAGLSVNYFYTGRDLERRSSLQESLNTISTSEGKFGAHDLAVTAGLGFRRSQALRYGAAVKFISQTIDDRSGASAALDLGALYDFTWRGRAYTAGAALQNLGPGIKFTERRYDLPLIARAGLSGRFGPALLAFDVSKPVDNYPFFAFGAEHPLGDKLLLRFGYRLRQHGNETGGWSGFSAGAGFSAGSMTFDYAMAPFGELGNTHRLTATLRFREPGSRDGTKKIAAPAPAAPLRPLQVTFERKPLPIVRGVTAYQVEGQVQGDAYLRSVAFTARAGAPDAASVELSAADPGESLLAGLPAVAAAWRLLSAPAGLAGEIRLGLETAPGAPAPEFYFLSGAAWRPAAVEAAGCSEAKCSYYVSVPAAGYYALALKRP